MCVVKKKTRSHSKDVVHTQYICSGNSIKSGLIKSEFKQPYSACHTYTVAFDPAKSFYWGGGGGLWEVSS